MSGAAAAPARPRRRRIILLVLAGALGAAAIALIVLPVALGPERAAVEPDDTFGEVEVYAVDDAGGLSPAPEEDSLTAGVWDAFVRVATIDFAAEVMVEYRVGDAPDSDTLAFVHQTEDPQAWVLAANLATSDDLAQLVPTLVHEYAHILTLGTGEMQDAASCATLELAEGCLAADATLLAFQERFWDGYGDEAPDPGNDDQELAAAFFAEHPDDFVSDYAATNVVEDVAESFMTFVLEERPTGDSTVADKLAFFWEVPEYVAIRERIRAEFADDLGLVP